MRLYNLSPEADATVSLCGAIFEYAQDLLLRPSVENDQGFDAPLCHREDRLLRVNLERQFGLK